jgi:hypothetical protein
MNDIEMKKDTHKRECFPIYGSSEPPGESRVNSALVELL